MHTLCTVIFNGHPRVFIWHHITLYIIQVSLFITVIHILYFILFTFALFFALPIQFKDQAVSLLTQYMFTCFHLTAVEPNLYFIVHTGSCDY